MAKTNFLRAALLKLVHHSVAKVGNARKESIRRSGVQIEFCFGRIIARRRNCRQAGCLRLLPAGTPGRNQQRGQLGEF